VLTFAVGNKVVQKERCVASRVAVQYTCME